MHGTKTKSSGYNNGSMKPLRRLKLTLSCLLAVLLVGGSALPSPALWQCRYSSRLVSAAFAATPSTMPCLMSGPATSEALSSSMPCCHPLKLTTHGGPQGKQALSRPACHPTLTSLAAVSAPGRTEAHSSLRQSLASVQAALPQAAAFAVSACFTLPLRQRPPPTVGSPSSAPTYSFGLRAPPTA